MSVALSSPVTEAAIDALEAIVPGRVGGGVKPASPEPPPRSFFPYCIVRTSIVRSEGSPPESKETGLHRVEVTSVGLDHAGAEWLVDQARTVLLDLTLPIDGHAVVWSEDAGGQGARPDFDVTPHRIFAVVVVNLFVSPASTGS